MRYATHTRTGNRYAILGLSNFKYHGMWTTRELVIYAPRKPHVVARVLVWVAVKILSWTGPIYARPYYDFAAKFEFKDR